MALAASRILDLHHGPDAADGRCRCMLGTAGNFAILAKSGISTVPTSAVTGNIGVSPAAATSITGFSLIADATNVFSTSPQVTGKVYAADYAPPTPSNLTTAVGDMELAFTDAAGRAPDVTELGAGNIGGMTLAPGVYKWGTGLLIPTDVTLSRQRDGRLDLPDRPGPHREQRREGPPGRRGAAQERLLAGRRPGGPRHDRALRGRRPDPDGDHAGQRARRSTAGCWRRRRSHSTAAPWSHPLRERRSRDWDGTNGSPFVPSPFQPPPRIPGKSSAGKSRTSRMRGAPVRSMSSRSIPSATPPASGMRPTASRKRSSSG